MKRRAKQYQNGCIDFDRRRGVYNFRFRDEEGRLRNKKLGTTMELKSQSAAERAAIPYRIAINVAEILEAPRGETLLFAKVIDVYMAEDMPQRHSTKRGYLSKIETYIRPRWADVDMITLAPADVESWLKSLTDLSAKSRKHIRSLMRQLYASAMRRKWMPVNVNPMSLVRIKGEGIRKKKRKKAVTLKGWMLLLKLLSWQPMMTMIATCVCLGLRCSELCGLKWGDFDFDNLLVKVQRGVVEGVVDDVKTEESFAELPLDDTLVKYLLAWREITEYKADSDWVFADPKTGGQMPLPGRSFQQNYLKPAAVQAEVCTEEDIFGWHQLRHLYKSLLADSKEVPIGVTKELMRHTSITTTMDEYGQAFDESKRKANSGVVKLLLN